MLLEKTTRLFALKAFFLMALLVSSLQAQVAPDRSGVGQAEFRAAELNIQTHYRTPNELPAQAMANAAADLAALGVRSDAGFVETRGGRWANLMMSRPMLPGRGHGNNLSWADLGRKAPRNDTQLSHAASQAFRKYVEANSHPLRIDSHELSDPGKVTVHRGGALIQIYMPRVFNGIPVRGSYLSGTINNGNLTLFGTEKWGDINTSTTPGISENEARQAVQSLVEPYRVNGGWGKTELVLVPVAVGQNLNNIPVGQGLDHRLAWTIRPAFDGDMRHFEALVDAHTGELLSFEDTNQYVASLRRVQGGVYPVTNDGIPPDGVEQAGWPMPYDNVSTPGGTVTTDSGGNLPAPVDGNITSTLSGQFIRMNDNCGAISLTSAGDIDFGTSGGTDCTTPGFGGAGNTHASRTGFHELNRIVEMGQGQLPGNSWLQQQLTANMNINLTCNAFWGGGTVNFYRSSDQCSNTGELAGVFDHEWGHGLDDNDAVPTIASPSGEGIADVYTALRLNTSCIGHNFQFSVCAGIDPCLSCTGVRDIDYLQRQSGQPHDYSWSNANCGTSTHCIGAVYAEAVWSLWKRELQGPPYNMDNNTAHEVVNRLTYIGAGNTGTWFSGGPPNGGCGGTSGYMNYLAADDDNGNLNDGTPHMTAIFNAFNDQEIACATPTVQDSGCAGSPTTAPALLASALDKSVNLSWGAVTDASSYEVFRTEGVFGCDFGKVRVAETVGTSFTDNGLQNDRDYFYVVIPKGSSAACFGPASNCASAAPAAGPNIDVDPDSASLAFLSGDGDTFIDNCEDATLSFDVINTGLGTLTNARITGVTVVSHAEIIVTTNFPATVAATMAQGASVSGSFDFHAGGLAFGDTVEFQVSVTADEIFPLVKTQTLSSSNAESDLLFSASKTWDFETGLDGWTLIQGTFNQTTSGGGAGGSAGYMASSTLLDNQCDQVRSPLFQLAATSTMTLQNNYEIEHFDGQWWDRANIAVLENGARNAVDPDGGRLYIASGAGASCVTVGQNGWADVNNNSWGSSSWSAAALGSAGRAGTPIQLDVAYGTDPLVNGKGFWFDKVTLTNIEELVADGQSDICDAGCTIDADCDDGAFCNGAETCNVGTGVCEAGTAPACDDSAFCNGVETCNETTDSCDAGAPPACDNGLFCDGTETCNEGTDSCDAGTAVVCDDGLFCNGTDTCNEATDICDAGTPPVCDNGLFCDGTETCNEGTDSCNAGTAVVCDDGLFCNGTDTCNEGTDSCDAGTPPVVSDGVTCTNDSCDEATDSIINTPNDGLCSNGLFCDGNETCDAALDCQAGTPPACDNGQFCDGDETCNEGTNSCDAGTPPDVNDGVTCTNDSCDEATDSIINTPDDGFCSNGLFCDGNETCDAVLDCQAGSDPCFGDACDEAADMCIAPPAEDVHVETLLAEPVSAGKGRKYGGATVTIYDENENPVGTEYLVTGNFTGSINEPNVSALTNGSGVAVLQTTGTAKKNVVVNFCVSDVSAGLLPYDAFDNESASFGCATTPELTDVHVQNIATDTQGAGGGSKVGTATVTIFGDNGQAQSGYTVIGTFGGDFDESTAPAATGPDGTVNFQTEATNKGKTSVTFCVKSVSGDVLYDDNDNASDSYACPSP